MRIAIISVGSVEISVFTIEHFRAIARLDVLNTVVCLYHALFCPVYSRWSFTEYVLALSILVSDTSKSTHIIEAHFMFKGVGVPHDMSEKFHALLR